ncbi:MAG TPA: NADH-quinone oxidoreductase subunit G [Actinomycetes bacterium]|nr:NADH-quinone oxidoreductase subunit G [Actinomycetes bacterium]
MSTPTNTPAGSNVPEVRQPEPISVTIDGIELTVPKGTLVIRAAEMLGIEIPRFCDHPLLDPVGACRQCLVEVEGQRKPLASCTTTVTDGMVVRTQLTSPVADKAQRGIMEMLLINHPLDCPVCDKGGECPLQNQAMTAGAPDTRFDDAKRLFEKPIAISAQVLLDRERCVLCARCTRFSQQVAGDPFIEMLDRGALQQVGIYEDEPFESYFSGNTVQICPVGALTGAKYRFRARPFDLVSTPSVCEHCASGCALRTDHRRGKIMRRLAGDDPAVNEEWNCDKGRWAFQYVRAADRITNPMVRDTDGALVPASWPEALHVAARGLSAAAGRAGVLTGGRLTHEDAYAYAKFARLALHTNDIDFRARPESDEETAVLAARVAGTGLGPTYADLEQAPAVLLVGFEPEDESPIIFLRLRKAARKRTAVYSIAPFASRGLAKLSGTVLPVAPGGDAWLLDQLSDGTAQDPALSAAGVALAKPAAVILVGERAATSQGTLSSVVRLARATGAAVSWVPRRAGDRSALEAGALPILLPGGRPVTDGAARAEVAEVWDVGVDALPATPGRSTGDIISAAATGRLGALLIGGVEVDDLADPAAALAAIDRVPFVVSLELRRSAITEYADVVFPIAATAEKDGTFIDWEGRERPFVAALNNVGIPSDGRVLTAIADEMDVPLRLGDPAAARVELHRLGVWTGVRAAEPMVGAAAAAVTGTGEAVLATWRLLLDAGRAQDGEEHLAGTARAPRVRLGKAIATELGAAEGDPVTVSTDRGRITLPLEITEMPDRVVWLPMNSPGSAVLRELGAGSGAVVRISAGGAE